MTVQGHWCFSQVYMSAHKMVAKSMFIFVQYSSAEKDDHTQF